VVWAVGGHGGDEASSFGLLDGVRGEHVDCVLGTQGCADEGADEVGTFDLHDLGGGSPLGEDTLERHVSCCSACGDVEGSFRRLKDAVYDTGRDEEVCLPVHGFWDAGLPGS
jgi:hypothetical protein